MSNLSLPIKLAFKNKKEMIAASMGLFFSLIVFICLLVFKISYQNKIYPNIYIDSLDVGGLTQNQAIEKLSSQQLYPKTHTITLMAEEAKLSSSSAQLNAKFDYNQAVINAFNLSHQQNKLSQITFLIKTSFEPIYIESQVKYDQKLIHNQILTLKQTFDVKGKKAFAKLATSGNINSLVINPGITGKAIKINETSKKIANSLSGKDASISASININPIKLNEDQVKQFFDRASLFINKKAVFKKEYSSFYLNDQDLISFLEFPTEISQEKLNTLLADWESNFLSDPQNAQFEYNADTLEIFKFVPHKDGLTLDAADTKQQIISLISNIESSQDLINEHEFELTVASKPPAITLSDLNDLGINDLIGFGDSWYQHSIPTRVFNVAHAAKQINHYIVKPNAEFSFNQAIGDVSKATGYKPAYIIKNGQTILGDGGGVCQVSTTLFRALLNAGLNITRRVPHSYRVSYYELNNQPGFDATVYSGNTDLRFINDTNGHLLITTEADSQKLYLKFELYGTDDGRTTEITTYKSWDYSPPPASVYIPDASLPSGKLQQIDWSASGIKASFANIIKDKDGNLIREDKYYSSYRPWSAKYLRGI
jgi:vancomycin resistance protein YoaR